MSAQLRNLMSAGVVAVIMSLPAIGDEPSEGARALLGHVGRVAQVGVTSAAANPFQPHAKQALLGRVAAKPTIVSTGSKSVTGEQAFLASGR